MGSLWSSLHDGLNMPAKPDNSHSSDTASHADTAPISVVIPPLDLSTLHRRHNGEIISVLCSKLNLVLFG